MADWQNLKQPHERLRWARTRAGYKTGSSAARSAKVDPGTYRSHERAPEDGGRVIDEGWAQLYSDTFNVHWPWLLTGAATPDTKYATENPLDRRWQELPQAERELALDLLEIAKRRA